MAPFDRTVAIWTPRLERRPQLDAELDKVRDVLGEVEIVEGVDEAPPPGWERLAPTAWNCKQSHLAVWQKALDDGIQTLCVFEDDVTFVDDFGPHLEAFLAEVPEWDMLYLGGQHWKLPMFVNERIAQGLRVGRTHAYVIRYDWLRDLNDIVSPLVGHIDDLIAQAREAKSPRVYCAFPWMCGQSGNYFERGIRPKQVAALLRAQEVTRLRQETSHGEP